MIIIVVRNIVQEKLNNFILLFYPDLFIHGKYVHSNVEDINILHWVIFAIRRTFGTFGLFCSP